MDKVQRTFFPKESDRFSEIWITLVTRLGSLAPVLTLLALILLFSLISPTFLTVNNMLNISAQISILALVAGGMTFVVLAAQIDLSVANVAMMAGILMALSYTSDVQFLQSNLFLSVLVAIVAAAGIGVLTGVTVTKLNIPSFAVTLAAMQISRGVTLVTTQARPIYDIPETLTDLGAARIGSVPVLAIIAAVVLLIFYLVLRYTHFGRYVYAVGGNPTAAKLVGIRTDLITFSCLVLAAVMSGIAGVLNVGRLGSAQTFGSEDLLIDSLAAVVIGGTSLFGGVGGIGNTVIGVLILGFLNNGLNQMTTNVFAKYLLKGIILLGALIINVMSVRLRDRATEAMRAALFTEEQPSEQTPVTEPPLDKAP